MTAGDLENVEKCDYCEDYLDESEGEPCVACKHWVCFQCILDHYIEHEKDGA